MSNIENMVLGLTIGTVYTGTLSAVLKATNLDQRIFDFVAPKLSHACAFGVLATLTQLTLTTTRTYFYTHLSRQQASRSQVVEITDTIAQRLNPILSAFSAAYVLNSMNYAVPYRFAAVCLIPFWIRVLAKA